MADSARSAPARWSKTHFPGLVYSLRPWSSGVPNGYVRTLPGDRVEIGVRNDDGVQVVLSLSRRDARLLAKRICQLLDDTGSRGKYGRFRRAKES